MVGLTILVVILCVMLGCCIGILIAAASDARYWKEVCAQLIATYDASQKKEENTIMVDGEDGEPQW